MTLFLLLKLQVIFLIILISLKNSWFINTINRYLISMYQFVLLSLRLLKITATYIGNLTLFVTKCVITIFPNFVTKMGLWLFQFHGVTVISDVHTDGVSLTSDLVTNKVAISRNQTICNNSILFVLLLIIYPFDFSILYQHTQGILFSMHFRPTLFVRQLIFTCHVSIKFNLADETGRKWDIWSPLCYSCQSLCTLGWRDFSWTFALRRQQQ